jgi:phosphate transport system substrate-binding protein
MGSLKILISLLALIAIFVTGCAPKGSPDTSPISIDGSTTLFDLTSAWAQAFIKSHPDMKILVSKSGTKKGIDSFLKGGCDIVETSRRLTTEEIFRARRTGVMVEEFYAGFAIYTVAVNPKNPVDKLTEDQVRDIFLGKITNWKDVGGQDRQIEVLYRAIGPDEYDYFLEKFVNISGNIDLNNLPPRFTILATPEEIVSRVTSDEDAIGYYFLLNHTEGVKALAVAKKSHDEFKKPSLDDALTGAYPILRPYFMYKNRNSRKPLDLFIKFIYSDEGSAITKGMYFVPVPTKGGDVDRDVLFDYT